MAELSASLSAENESNIQYNTMAELRRLLFGNYSEHILQKKYGPLVASEICRKFPKEPYIGTFYGTDPALIIQDPNILKLVLSKDFNYFSGRANTDYSNREILTKNMFFRGGDEWKALRLNLTPLFTMAKVKNMFPIINECTKELNEYIEELLKSNEKISVRSLLSRYTMSCIMSCSYGINPNTLKRDEGNNNIFVIIGEKLFDTSVKQNLKLIMHTMWPQVFYGLRLKLFSDEIESFFYKLYLDTTKSKHLNELFKSDYIDHFLELKKKKYIYSEPVKNSNIENKKVVRIEVNQELMVYQSLSLFGAGFETTSTAMTFLLYELAKNKHIQDKVIEEVDAYLKRHNGVVDYECVNEMSYLEACISETLRLYPVIGLLTREVMSNYTLPTGLTLEKGNRIHIPVYHLHRNPDYFPEPEVFRPERFIGEERKKINQYAFLPFGNGPRICIGIRFAKITMMAGLLMILRKYMLDLAEDMPVKINFKPVGCKKHRLLDKYDTFSDCLGGVVASMYGCTPGGPGEHILQKKYGPLVASEICRKFPKEPYIGTFYGTDPALIIQDPNILKLILSKDFTYFSGRENTDYSNREILTKNIFFRGGDEWKALRLNLTPLFTIAKVKNMFPIIKECTKELDEYVEELLKSHEKVSVQSLLSRYTMSCFISCSYGINPNTLKRDEANNNIFVIIGEKIFDTSIKQSLKIILRTMWPHVFYGLRLKLFSDEILFFFNKLFLDASKSRDSNDLSRNDYIDHFLELKKNKYIYSESFKNSNIENKELVRIEVNQELIAYQSFSLFGAGFETTSIAMTFLLYELAKNKNIQEKVIEEVDEYFERHNGVVDYECVNELSYLEACISETLRLYPVLGLLTREVMSSYTLPTGLTLEKGNRIHIPVYHLHRNPDYFPEPEVFRPERFIGEERKKINQYAFLPFGNGPRICIGIRFAKMPMMAGMLMIFKKYKLDLAENMPFKINFQPVRFSGICSVVCLSFTQSQKTPGMLQIMMCGFNLRLKCLTIGYLHLLASVVDIGCHVLVVAILSNGFQCDIKAESLSVIDLPWLQLLLLVINFGTHGFYPFPLDLRSYYDHMQFVVEPRCYPGMLHLSLIDIINFFINVIWLKFVIAFVTAVHKRDPEPMRMFFGLSLLKLIVQVIYFTYQFNMGFASPQYSFLIAADTGISVIFLMIINAYIFQVRHELLQKKVDQPPTYIECLMNTPLPKVDEKNTILVIDDKKPQLPTEVESKETL
ncbi:unnamed protein product, partial [Brenthis ino]